MPDLAINTAINTSVRLRTAVLPSQGLSNTIDLSGRTKTVREPNVLNTRDRRNQNSLHEAAAARFSSNDEGSRNEGGLTRGVPSKAPAALLHAMIGQMGGAESSTYKGMVVDLTI